MGDMWLYGTDYTHMEYTYPSYQSSNYVNDLHLCITDRLDINRMDALAVDIDVLGIRRRFDADMGAVDASQNIWKASHIMKCKFVCSCLVRTGRKSYCDLCQLGDSLGDPVYYVADGRLSHSSAASHHPLEATYRYCRIGEQ